MLHTALGRLKAAGLARVPALTGIRAVPALARIRAVPALARAARAHDGQGTVEYVGLILLVSVVLAGVLAAGFTGDAGIAKAITEKLKDAIDSVGGS